MKKIIAIFLFILSSNIFAQINKSIILSLPYDQAPFDVKIECSGIYAVSNFEIEKNKISLIDFNKPVKHYFNKNNFVNTVELTTDKNNIASDPNRKTITKPIFFEGGKTDLFNDDGILKNILGDSFSLKIENKSFLLINSSLPKNQIQQKLYFENDLAYADLIGIDADGFIYLLIEKYIQQVPLKIRREVYTLTGRGEIQSILQLPHIKYLFTINDLQIDEEGNLFHLLTLEDRLEIFKWEGLKNKSEKIIHYPIKYNYQLHFNELLPVNEIETEPVQNKITSAKRTMALRIGESYVYHKYYCTSANLAPSDVIAPDGDIVRTPARLRVGPNARVPYKWGGFSTLTQFDAGLAQGKYAGDINTNGVSSYAVGVDCSGFVSRCWQMGYHASTSYMPNITNLYGDWSNLKPGDAVHKVGHVRLYISTQPNGSIKIVESTSRGWGVSYFSYAPSDLQSYTPRYYTNMEDDYFENQPKLLSVTLENSNVNIKWECNEAEVKGYRLYRSPDRVDWSLIQNESTLTEKFATISFQQGDSYYRVSSVKNNPPNYSESDLSNELGFGNYGYDDTYLIVDGFDREDDSWRGAGHKFAGRYGKSLISSPVNFESIKSSELESAGINLTNYAGVFWIAGDQGTDDETFNSYEQSVIASYLENGGNLFVSGSEIGYDLDYKGSASDRSFYNNYLKADYVSDDAGVLYAAGKPNTSMHYCSLYFGQTYDENFPDEIAPYGGSTICMLYSNQKTAGIEYTGAFGGSNTTGKLIYLAFPLETTADNTAFDLVIVNALLYFDPSIVDVNDKQQVVPTAYSLSQNYPNPFNPTTKIKYQLPADVKGEMSKVQIKIYDILGNMLADLVNEQKSPGTYEVEWNAVNQPSGIYFYKITAGSFSKTMKMILLK
ncbi:MAG: T9SS type A sorting domain-containing protein [Ignavibacteriae bacterium]|nr:T9SS C-terminal target domain-containing protein [Ignavibacteriota bacterium]NOH00023.1 T9SS type A sorting domain-containing protein [Ignavibacteriota bacterium]